MNKKKICSTCNIYLGRDKYKKDRTVCKSCCNEKKEKNNKNISTGNENSVSNQQPTIDFFNNTINNRTLIIELSNYRKTYPMIFF